MKLVENSLTVLIFILGEYEKEHGLEQFHKEFENKIADLCLFSVIWGMGGILEEQYRKSFSDFLFQMIFYVDVKTNMDLDLDLNNWEPRALTAKFN